MNQTDDQTGRTEPPDDADRLTRMIEASVRITESLELSDVLQGVADGARAMVDAQRATVTVLDDGTRQPTFVTSGRTPDEQQLMLQHPGGPEVFEHLSALKEPLRVADFSQFLRESGLPDIGPPLEPAGAFLANPILHLGEQVGSIYLRRDAEFTAEDEGMLAPFVAQAALAIANAQRYREEQLARANLETLVNTSPIGVVVFDAATGALSTINREALRIVEELRDPDQSPEQMLEALSYRRLDGREFTLNQATLVEMLNRGATIRSEEISVQAPDGRRVNTIVNVTSIESPAGGVASVVVTMQDLGPIKDANRQRAEFLGLVSQELLTPLTSIKGSAAAVQQDLARLDLTKAQQFFSIIEWQADRMRRQIADLVQIAQIETGTLNLTPEPIDLASLVQQAREVFRESGAGQQLEIDLAEDLLPVSADRQRALQVLDHLLANAAAYTPEGSPITVSARRIGTDVEICVADQGRGLVTQPLPLLFSNILRREPDADGGPRGESLGLAVCQGIVESHGGRIWAESDGPGLGSRFRFTLPVAEEANAPASGPLRSGQPATRGQGHLLVLDDDPQAIWHIRNSLSEAGYRLTVGSREEELERLIALEQPHLILLGGLPARTDRLDIVRRLLSLTDAPLIVFSRAGANRERELAQAFEVGVDDYIVTPFSPTELVARVGAALRRADAPGRARARASFEMDGLAIDYGQRRVSLDGKALALTGTEYRLLCELALYQGQPLSREHLMRRVWSARDSDDSRVVRAYIKRLRRKLGDRAEDPRFVFNEPRVGYRLGASLIPEQSAE